MTVMAGLFMSATDGRCMKRLTIRVPDDLKEEIEERAKAEDMSQSEAARTLLERGMEAERIEQEAERLRNEKRMLLEQREENTELRRYVEDELSYREAGLGTRVKWWLFGKGE